MFATEASRPVRAEDLPVATAKVNGARAFTDDEEHLIFRFIEAGGRFESAAYHTRLTVNGIRKVCARVRDRLHKEKGLVPDSDQPASPCGDSIDGSDDTAVSAPPQPQEEENSL